MTSDTLAPGGVTAPAASATAPGDTTASGAPSLVASERPQAPSPDAPGVRVLGIRHHGPGSSRAVVGALEDYQPDCVLVEGPADADDLIEWVGPQMTPPVALLAWQTDAPSHSAFWPMAVFSPEWQALSWAVAHGVRAQFMDLPAAVQLAERQDQEEDRAPGPGAAPAAGERAPSGPRDPGGPREPAATGGTGTGAGAQGAEEPGGSAGQQARGTDTASEPPADGLPAHEPPAEPPADEPPADGLPDGPSADGHPGPEPPDTPQVRTDPIAELARLAGYEDPEAWWEDTIELRLAGDPFDALTEAIGLLRQAAPESDPYTLRREAHMRRVLRAARRAGYRRIAVVCGAWHAPALAGRPPKVSEDNALLKGMRKVRTRTTWVPWTHRRLATSSGYGAGVASPGWYHHLFTAPDQPVIRWLTLVAASLRRQDLPVSSAHIIEAARLAQALAAMRGRPLPGSDELGEAVLSVMCEGSATRAALATREVLVGEALGVVPEGVPMVPLDADLRSRARSLRLPLSASPRKLTLDLRRPLDLERSRFLYRIGILGVDWASQQQASSKGTFKEVWSLEWVPELSVKVIEAAAFGNTVAEAAGNALLADSTSLPQVTQAVEEALAADLTSVMPELLRILDDQAARESDITHLLTSLPALARAQRYGDVRGTDASSLAAVTWAVLVRACAGLPAAAANVDQQVARSLRTAIDEVQAVIGLLDEQCADLWRETLLRALGGHCLPGILAGRLTRLLLDAGHLERADAAARLARALSPGTEPTEQAEWIEGFLSGEILLLSYDPQLLRILDQWVRRIGDRAFVDVLPALRRAFSQWPGPQLQDLARQVATLGEDEEPQDTVDDLADAGPILKTVSTILGGAS
mgnify:FL=1